MAIEHPWNVTKYGPLIIEICEPEAIQKLRGNCLLLSYEMPIQIYSIEHIILTVIIQMLFILNLILLLMHTLSATHLEWNPLPNYTANLLLICHLFATGTKLPGAMADFTRKIVEVAALNFWEILVHSEYATSSELDDLKYGLR